jgi:hypothetical protein
MSHSRTEERTDTVGYGGVEAHAQAAQSARLFHPSITARPSPDEKARFTLIARHVGLSESALALRAIRLLLDHDEQWLARQPDLKWEHVAASDRITRTKTISDPARAQLLETRKAVIAGWNAIAAKLEAQGEITLGADVRYFAMHLPPVRTDRERLAVHLIEAKARKAEKTHENDKVRDRTSDRSR